jgi:ribosomal protein S18 acetylase RimI-like enzyme
MHEALDPDRYGMLPDVVDRYARWLPQRASDPTSVFLFAHQGGQPAGFLIATTEESIPIYRTPRFGFIHDVWVQPEFRRSGTALALVQEACRRFAAMGLEVRLETAHANETARRAFSKAGFRASTIEMLRPRP